MNARNLILVGAAWTVALGAGFGVRRAMQNPGPGASDRDPDMGEERAVPEAKHGSPSSPGGVDVESQVRELMARADGTRSRDTLETILEIDPVAEYGRLALWMVDASGEEIGSYWDAYRQRENRSNEVNDLIFINWTRADPEAAVTASSGTDDEHYAWWAWACHDPGKALAEVVVRDPERLNNVTWGIGEFHAEWAMKHFDEIPEEARDNIFRGMVKWDDTADPGAILDFLSEHGRGTDGRMFRALVRKDPWAAYDRVIGGGGRVSEPWTGDNSMDVLISTMASAHPDLLERMSQLTPPGELKRKMEASAFDSLLDKDPEAAVELALAQKAPLAAANQLSKVGKSLLESDPDRAFEMAERLFDLPQDAVLGRTRVEYSSGTSSHGGNGGNDGFLSLLVAEDARRTMDLAMNAGGAESGHHETVELVADSWLQQDLYGFSEWAAELETSPQRTVAINSLVNHLSNESLHLEAVQWCATEETLRSSLPWRVQRWAQADPDGARAWVEQADLNPAERISIEQQLK